MGSVSSLFAELPELVSLAALAHARLAVRGERVLRVRLRLVGRQQVPDLLSLGLLGHLEGAERLPAGLGPDTVLLAVGR